MQSKATANTQLAHNGDAAAHGLRHTLSERQSQSCTVNLCCGNCRASIKRLKNLVQLRAVDADSVVLHADPHLLHMVDVTQAGKSTDRDAPVVPAVFHSIDHKVLQTLTYSRKISRDRREILSQAFLNREPRLLRQRSRVC